MSQPTVIIYDRLSRLFADERPDHRIKQCREYAAQRGWRVVHVATDTNVSGATALEDREGMREVLAKLPHADYVIAAKLDRFARSVLEFQRLLKAAKAAGATVVTADGMVSPENSMLIINVMSAFAEWERETITTRIRDSKEYFRARGNHLGGLAPYGYRVVGPTNNKRWEIDPVSAEVIRECARRVLTEGKSLTGLADDLNERQIPPPAEYARQRDGRTLGPRKDGKPRAVPRWHSTTLRDVLYTQAIRGYLVQADNTPGTRRSALTNQAVLDSEGAPISVGPEILDAETWSAVRAVIDGKAVGRGKSRAGKGLLLHIARCSECEGPMYRSQRADVGRDYSTYFCQRGVGKKGTHRPNVIVAGPVEEIVTADYLKRFGGFRLMQWVEPDGSALLQLSEVSGQIERLAGNLVNLDPNGPAARIVVNQIGALERRQSELAVTAGQAEGRWEPTGRTIAEEWAARDTEGRTALLSDLGASLTVRPFTTGAMRRFDPERLSLSFTGPAWYRALSEDDDERRYLGTLLDIAEHESV